MESKAAAAPAEPAKIAVLPLVEKDYDAQEIGRAHV